MATIQRFTNKVVLVTGGSGAIGAATASRFVSEGARVVLVDIDESALVANVNSLRTQGHDVDGIAADLSSEKDAVAALNFAERRYGRIDAAALIAGIAGPRAPVHQLDVADWDRVMASNSRSMFVSLKASAHSMIRLGVKGAIVTMSSSMAQWDVLDGGAAYAASKGAVLSLTRAAAYDLAKFGIRVNAVCPGVVDTALGVPTHASRDTVTPTAEQFANRIPLHRIGRPADVAATVAHLASDDSAHVTGAGWLIDGGQTLQSWANSPLVG
jgi:NAD(P)-dependent dehydrogenase (short-subunit alcohol dehydrogenase family)